MKRIELKTVPVTSMELNPPMILNYGTEMMNAMRSPGDHGVDYNEMARVIPLLQKIEEAKGDKYLYLEDAEHQIVVNYLQQSKFRLSLLEIFEMLSSIINAPECKPQVRDNPAEEKVA